MHRVLKNAILALVLASAAASTVQAAEIVYQTSNNVRLRAPGDAGYLDRSNLFALATAANAQALPTAISPIPEPPVYVMLLIGVGLVSLVARRPKAPPKFSKES